MSNKKINEEKIIELVEKYNDCIIEEIFENHKVMGNYVCITCDLREETIDGKDYFLGGIYDLLNDLNAFNNIENMEDDIFDGDDGGYFFYLTFEWVL